MLYDIEYGDASLEILEQLEIQDSEYYNIKKVMCDSSYERLRKMSQKGIERFIRLNAHKGGLDRIAYLIDGRACNIHLARKALRKWNREIDALRYLERRF